MANEAPQISLMEQKLPDNITENLLLEGINSSELLNNSDLAQISNILSTARFDLSAMLNEEVDDLQFQRICADLLAKTSEEIKIKEKKAQKPKIDVNDVYAHLKRQPWQYAKNKLSPKKSEEKQCTNDKQMTAGSNGWKSYMSQMCQHKNNFEPGSMDVEDSKSDNDEDEGSEQVLLKSGITLMGDENKKIKFKTAAKCSVENDSEIDDSEDEESFVKSNVMTMMGHETIERINK